jgi:glutamate N-acetyltransferase/amino-acid N-acetyltransferase
VIARATNSSPSDDAARQAAHRASLSAATPSFPAGFSLRAAKLSFVPKEAPSMGPLPMNVCLLSFPPTSSYEIALTRNVLCGAPITYIRDNILAGRPPLGSLLINNKISNVCAPTGLADAAELCKAVEAALPGAALPSSTGVLGWALPLPERLAARPPLLAGGGGGTPLDFATAIMTTDRYPKLRSRSVGGSVVMGVAKGAGMIEPNLGTMLAYVLLDFDIPAEDFEEVAGGVVDGSFNCVSVDGDESTSDTVVVVSSNEGRRPDRSEYPLIREALEGICGELARDIVRNGEVRGRERSSVPASGGFDDDI